MRRRRNAEVVFEPWMAAIPLVLAAGGVTYALASVLLDNGLPAGVVPPAPYRGVPFATGLRRPAWPLLTNVQRVGEVAYRDINGQLHGNYARRFGADRGGRHHVGIDLYARYGDPVIAMGDGVVVAAQTFHLGSWALLVDHGPFVVLYGEIAPSSWRDVGVRVGDRVRKGQEIASVACMNWEGRNCVSHMLHLETYRPGTLQNKAWYVGNNPPAALLDPTLLLLHASKSA